MVVVVVGLNTHNAGNTWNGLVAGVMMGMLIICC